MDEQEFPMSSKASSTVSEQKTNHTIDVDKRLPKEALKVKSSTYDEEDCSYMLRILEKDAFSTIVSAFRAQGMLNDYKRVLLEHLKSALFISDEYYHAEIRQAANDEVLSKIAETLNPSYDTYAQWGIEGLDPIPHFDDIPIQDDIDDDGNLSDANELLRLAKAHNARLRNANVALHQMISLPKAPYVPERLRLLLRETEKDYEGRIISFASGGDQINARNSRSGCGMIKTETLLRDASQQFGKITESAEESYVDDSSQKTALYYDVTPSTSTARPNSLDLATSCPSSSSSSTPVITSLDQAVLAPKSAAQGDESFDSQVIGEYVRPKKRRLRQRDLSATCARVLPFRFQSPAPGQKNKPIRGNPDRRPPRQTSPSGISNFTSASSLPSSPSVAGAHSSHVTTLPAFRTVPTSSTTVINSGRFHQVPHLFTSVKLTIMDYEFYLGVVIKRTRTLSSGGNESSALDGSSAISRQLSNAQNVFRIQQPVQRAYIRSSSGQRFYASPIVSAYNNPARPYYGNPNTVVGFMRSVSSSSPRSSYTISSGPSTSSSCHLQPQTITSSEIQRLVAQAAASGQPQQYRSVRRPPPRPVVLTSSPRFSVTNQRQGLSSSPAPFINLTEMSGTNSCVLQQQLAVHPVRVTHRTVPPPSSSVVATTQRSHSVLSAGLDDNTSLTTNMPLQRAESSDLDLQHSDPDTIAAVNSITQDSDETMEQERRTDIDRPVITVTPDETSPQGANFSFFVVDMVTVNGINKYLVVRLECDEVLLPESRCILPGYENNSTNVQIAQLQQRAANEEIPMIVSYRGANQDGSRDRTSHLVPEQYANGLIHQEGQNVINYVTASQCIQ
uniref:ENT domain-containing protein n=1 Tax=Setaria digitata TaxID=48799 RepID=A0A915PEM3_9BILA